MMTAKETAVELARILLLNEIEYLKFLKTQKEAAADDSRQEDPATAHKDTPAKKPEKRKYTRQWVEN